MFALGTFLTRRLWMKASPRCGFCIRTWLIQNQSIMMCLHCPDSDLFTPSLALWPGVTSLVRTNELCADVPGSFQKSNETITLRNVTTRDRWIEEWFRATFPTPNVYDCLFARSCYPRVWPTVPVPCPCSPARALGHIHPGVPGRNCCTVTLIDRNSNRWRVAKITYNEYLWSLPFAVLRKGGGEG